MNTYNDFLQSKCLVVPAAGIDVPSSAINTKLFPFQRDLTRWALHKGRAAIFADTGLGKSAMQLSWAEQAANRTLILAPLAVAQQTVKEGAKFGIDVVYARTQATAPDRGITITNYEMISHFDPSTFGAVVLDESGILKNFEGRTRSLLTKTFAQTPMRLCCTATPAPNDIAEIANHAEFLGIMTRMEMLAAFFVHDDAGWRIRGHAREPFYRWLASWGMSIKKPSDLGYSDDGYQLPPLNIKKEIVNSQYVPDGQLLNTGLKGINDRAKVRRATTDIRVSVATQLIQQSRRQWIAWVGLNDEGRALAERISDAVLVEGQQSPEQKTQLLGDFLEKRARVLITKPSIAGHGLNLQQCADMVFVGLGDSFEQYYQCIRRCWRFGQTQPVTAHIILSDVEEPIYFNVLRKEREAKKLSHALIKYVASYEKAEIEERKVDDFAYREGNAHGDGWQALLGDSCERMAELPSNSIHLSVFSPPFSQLYVYSNSERDLGNSSSGEEFFAHFQFIIKELLRVTIPGRVCTVHVADVPAMLVRDGYIGMKDFSGDVVRAFIAAGWTYDGRIPLDKNQQAQAIRTHAKALVKSQLEKDSSWLRPALPDYILKFRKPGDNPIPVTPVANGEMTMDTWIEWASPTWPNPIDHCQDIGAFPTWYGIEESDTLNAAEARNKDDGRHICPLQLGTIERCIKLYSNPGELVLSPFMGIGSEGVQAIKYGRRFWGCELKPEYFRVAVKNLQEAELLAKPLDLFQWAAEQNV